MGFCFSLMEQSTGRQLAGRLRGGGAILPLEPPLVVQSVAPFLPSGKEEMSDQGRPYLTISVSASLSSHDCR